MTNSAASPSQASPGFQTLYIFGAGGAGREIAWLAHKIWGADIKVRHLVDRRSFLREEANGLPVDLLSEVEIHHNARYVVALGDPAMRRKAASDCANAGFLAATLVHPHIEISSWVKLGEGSIVCAGTVITTNVEIGSHVYVNVGCTISHDVAIGDFSTICPGVHIAGQVSIGEGVFIGIGASIINGSPDAPLTIGSGAIVAAGACVTEPVAAGALVAGVPAIRRN